MDDTWCDALADSAFTLARRFAAGGTLWVWSPQWPWHAHHVAVEFVHPVVVGTRALDAVALPDATRDPVGWLRTAARPQDSVLVLASAGEPAAHTLVRRASIWGLRTLWIGPGPAPAPGAADHVLFAGELPDAVHDGSLVLAYHLLWELTQVCLEHPGLLATQAGEGCERAVCITCSDEGRLAEVIAVAGTEATVRSASGIEPIDVTLVGPIAPGSVVLVHAGTAIATVEDPTPGTTVSP